MELTLRDVFWFVLVVGLALGWWTDHKTYKAIVIENQFLKAGEEFTQKEIEELRDEVARLQVEAELYKARYGDLPVNLPR